MFMVLDAPDPEELPLPGAPAPLTASASSEGDKRSTEDEDEATQPPLAMVVSLPCAHVFHSACLLPWFSRPGQTTCPVCRFNVDPENLTFRPPRMRRRQGNGPGAAGTTPLPETGAAFPDIPEGPGAIIDIVIGTFEIPRGENDQAEPEDPVSADTPAPPSTDSSMPGLEAPTPTSGQTQNTPTADSATAQATPQQEAGTQQPAPPHPQPRVQRTHMIFRRGPMNQPMGSQPQPQPRSEPQPQSETTQIGFDFIFGGPNGFIRGGNMPIPPPFLVPPRPQSAPQNNTSRSTTTMPSAEPTTGNGDNANVNGPTDTAQAQNGAHQNIGMRWPFGFGPMPGVPHTPPTFSMPGFPPGAVPVPPPRNSMPGGMRPRRPRKEWAPPPPPGLTLRERVERRERESGLRCDDVSCGIAPTDEDPEPVRPSGLTCERSMLAIKRDRGAGEPICVHRFHPACLVDAGRVAGWGSHVGEDARKEEGVEVACSRCRETGHVEFAEWEEGVRASEEGA